MRFKIDRTDTGDLILMNEILPGSGEAVSVALRLTPAEAMELAQQLAPGPRLALVRKPKYPFLIEGFLEAMNDIGAYGHEKYGSDSFHARRELGDTLRGELARTSTDEIARHAREHFEAYQDGIAHDHFDTRKHQLAAVAFNALMEYYFADLESE